MLAKLRRQRKRTYQTGSGPSSAVAHSKDGHLGLVGGRTDEVRDLRAVCLGILADPKGIPVCVDALQMDWTG